MAGSSQQYTDLLPKDTHAAIVGETGCGKTVFILDLLEGPFREVFRHIVQRCGITRLITSAPGSGWTLRSTL